MRTPLLLLILVAIAACAAEEDAAPTFSMTDSAGIRIAHSTAPAWAPGEGWTISEVPSVEIGVLEGEDEYLLDQVMAGTRQSNGEVLIVNAGTREIRRYSASGEYLATIGGPGQGPGEFSYPGQVLAGAGDTIIVWDNPAHRITRFDPHGEFIDVVSIDRGKIAATIQRPFFSEMSELLPDGRLLVRLFEGGGPDTYPSGLFRPRGGAVVTDIGISDMDTLRLFGGIEQMYVETPQRQMPMIPVHAKRSWVTYQGDPSRVCIGDQQEFEITCFGATGDETRIRWAGEPIAVTSAERDAWADRLMGLYAGRMDEADARRALSELVGPEHRPAYGAIQLDRLGYLWAVDPGPYSEQQQTTTHLVFDPEGQLLGRVVVPPVRILEIGEDYVLAVRRDEADVEHVGVYDLVR